jgi:hypothetical protein
MIGDGNWWAGGVVGDKADLGTSIMKRGDPFCRHPELHRAQIDHAIKIEKRRVVGVK